MKVEAETGAIEPQAKGPIEPPELEGGAGEVSLPDSSEGRQPCGPLDFEVLTCRTPGE